MTVHMQRHLDEIERRILDLAGDVEAAVQRALEAVSSRDAELAQRVIDADAEIDRKELATEEACLETLALEQPVAMDLRFVVAVLKMNNDLERIADLAANIAEQAQLLAEEPWVDTAPFLGELPELAQAMLREALAALLAMDVAGAEGVLERDDRVDELHRRLYGTVQDAIAARPEDCPQLIHVLVIARCLERIGDLATNIAEDVIYTRRGEVRRHAPTPRRPAP